MARQISGRSVPCMIRIEAAGVGIDTDKHAATLTPGSWCFARCYDFLIHYNNDITEAHFISAGLDYPGVGSEHIYLKDIERTKYYCIFFQRNKISDS